VFDFEWICCKRLDAELDESGDGNDWMWLGVPESEPDPEDKTGVEDGTIDVSLIVSSLSSSSSSSSLLKIVITSIFWRFGSVFSGAISFKSFQWINFIWIYERLNTLTHKKLFYFWSFVTLGLEFRNYSPS
jgi:hypothetical protein